LQKLADDFSTQPQAPINQASADWAATKAAYRFFENPHAAAKKIFAAHRLRTSQRIEGQQVVLAIQDTTYLNYSHHPQTTGLGPIGDRRSDAQGLILHSTLVVTPAGLPLGLQDLRSMRLTSRDLRITQLGSQVIAEQTLS
jgi:Transposase DNA-binding